MYIYKISFILTYTVVFLTHQWVPGALTPGVMQPGPEAENSLPSNIKVKHGWTINPPHLYIFMAYSGTNLS